MIVCSNGGIIPPIAQDLHRENIENVVENAVRSSSVSFDDVTAIAATVKPGSLSIYNAILHSDS